MKGFSQRLSLRTKATLIILLVGLGPPLTLSVYSAVIIKPSIYEDAQNDLVYIAESVTRSIEKAILNHKELILVLSTTPCLKSWIQDDSDSASYDQIHEIFERYSSIVSHIAQVRYINSTGYEW